MPRVRLQGTWSFTAIRYPYDPSVLQDPQSFLAEVFLCKNALFNIASANYFKSCNQFLCLLPPLLCCTCESIQTVLTKPSFNIYRYRPLLLQASSILLFRPSRIAFWARKYAIKPNSALSSDKICLYAEPVPLAFTVYGGRERVGVTQNGGAYICSVCVYILSPKQLN